MKINYKISHLTPELLRRTAEISGLGTHHCAIIDQAGERNQMFSAVFNNRWPQEIHHLRAAHLLRPRSAWTMVLTRVCSRNRKRCPPHRGTQCPPSAGSLPSQLYCRPCLKPTVGWGLRWEWYPSRECRMCTVAAARWRNNGPPPDAPHVPAPVAVLSGRSCSGAGSYCLEAQSATRVNCTGLSTSLCPAGIGKG